MTTKEYQTTRDRLLATQEPFLVLNKEEVIAENQNTYRIGDLSVMVSDEVQDRLDQLIGLAPAQRKGLRETFGDNTMTNFRNSLAMSNCVKKPTKFALVANPSQLIVDGIVPLKGEAIPMGAFFDVVEMFADKHSYEIERIEHSDNGTYGITVRLLPVHAQYDAFFDDDEFLTNGYYMKWNLGEIELGNYYMRLVCTNGSMQLTQKALGHIHNLNDQQINYFINNTQKEGVIKHNLFSFKNAARQANETPASLAELYYAKRLLTRHGAPEDLAEQLMPYTRLLEQYAQAGYDCRHLNTTQTKSDIMMWDVFNELTDFASHTPLWQPDDNRRSSLMQQSMSLLQRKRDIQPYYTIFEN